MSERNVLLLNIAHHLAWSLTHPGLLPAHHELLDEMITRALTPVQQENLRAYLTTEHLVTEEAIQRDLIILLLGAEAGRWMACPIAPWCANDGCRSRVPHLDFEHCDDQSPPCQPVDLTCISFRPYDDWPRIGTLALDAVLCYVDSRFAYFTTQPLNQQWGDDWNNVPYDCNAGQPYQARPEHGEHWAIYKIALGYEVERTKAYMSVQSINAGLSPWLQSYAWEAEENQFAIYAGTSLRDVMQTLLSHGVEVYLPANQEDAGAAGELG